MTNPYAPQDPYVPQGYLPPANVYYQPQAGADPNDPLINPPNFGINGWFARVGGLFKRSWRSLLPIFAITHILPVLGFAAIGVVAALAIGGSAMSWAASQSRVDPNTVDSPELPDWLGFGLAALFGVILILVVVFMIMQMVGYAAATYAATREAIGQPVRLGEALSYGFKRSLGLAGWQIVVGLLILLGFVACILPAFYVYAATALFGPIYLFERKEPIRRTFNIFNNNLGRVLGRLALILAATIAASVISNVFGLIGDVATGYSDDPTLIIGSAVIGSLFGLVIQLPLTMFTFAGILLTYTEQRGYEGPVNSGHLAAEL
ncbi:MAG TPA: hypothetical protein VFC19_46485 [Candidatus Limnocylindrales bacterium]|nr:hypothetical protein [Candidatus Limnocylindrales bacterium]